MEIKRVVLTFGELAKSDKLMGRCEAKGAGEVL
jgi:hypothetical protein